MHGNSGQKRGPMFWFSVQVVHIINDLDHWASESTMRATFWMQKGFSFHIHCTYPIHPLSVELHYSWVKDRCDASLKSGLHMWH